MANTPGIKVPVTAELEGVALAGDTRAVIEAARAGVEPSPLELGQIYAVAQADGTVRVVDLDTEQHRARISGHPVRKVASVTFTEHASLSQYVVAHGEPEATTLWADQHQGRIIAVLNDHENQYLGTGETITPMAGDPGHRDHRAVLALRTTPEWAAWTAASGQLFDQEEFANFLEDHALDVRNPTASELLEVATSIQATTGASVKSAIRLESGEVQVAYEEQIAASAGRSGQLKIPTRISLGLAPFDGVDAYKVDARFRYRVGNGRLRLGVVLDRPEDVLRAAFGDIVTQVQAATGLSVLYGNPG